MIMSLCLHSYTNAPVLYHRSHFTSFFVLQQFEFTKTPPPTSNYKEEKIEFSKKLLKYYITLAQYESTLVLLRAVSLHVPVTTLGVHFMFQHTYQENTHLYRGDRQLHVHAPAQLEGYVHTYTS